MLTLGKGKLNKAKPKDKSPRREGLPPSVPVLAPFDEFKASPVRPTRQSTGTDLLPGLPDKVPRTKKSPLPKDPKPKEGTLEVPGLSVPPPKEHRELPSEEDKDKSIESSSNQTGDKGLDAMDKSIESSSDQTGDKGLDAMGKSIESSSHQTGAKGLDAVDPSIGSSSSQEGIRSLEDKEAEAWLANTKSMFDERTNGTKKWGDDLSDDGDQDTSDKGSKVTKDNKGGVTVMVSPLMRMTKILKRSTIILAPLLPQRKHLRRKENSPSNLSRIAMKA